MNQKELTERAVRQIEQRVAGIPPEPRVVHCEEETDWRELMLRNVSHHKLHVLARGADIVIFFDEEGKEIGWRDDGRGGAAQPNWIDRESFRLLVVQELDLPEQARLGRLRPVELKPLGWTLEGVLFLSATPTEDQVLRVWVQPEENHVIQCLKGPLPPTPQENKP